MADDPARNQLQLVTQARDRLIDARVGLRDAVAAARADGASWAAIAAALGISKQSAWDRFGNPRHEHRHEGRDRPGGFGR